MNFSFSLSDHELVWKYVDWVLSKDPEAGVQVNIQCLIPCLHQGENIISCHNSCSNSLYYFCVWVN